MTHNSFANEFITFSKTYVRASGAPVTLSDSISPLEFNTTWLLRVINGSLTDDSIETVSSSFLYINSVEVLQMNDFNQNVTLIEIPISLTSSNSIDVELRGKSGGRITVEIVGKDTNLPTAIWLMPALSQYSNTSMITAKVQLNDDISGIDASGLTIDLDDVPITANFPPITEPVLSITLETGLNLTDGEHTLNAQVVDRAGNTNTQSLSFTIDTTPPDIAISGVLNNEYANTDIIPIISITEINEDTRSILLNGSDFTSGTTITVEGVYTLDVAVTDLAGNSTSETVTFTIDKTAPVIVISGVFNGMYSNSDVKPIMDITEINLNTSTIQLNGQAFTSGAVVTDEGEYTLVVSSTDAAGNSASETVEFSIDKTAPEITVTGVVSGQIFGDQVAPGITIGDSNPGSSIITLNSLPYVSGTPILDENVYLLEISATDLAGNETSLSVRFHH